MAVGKASAVKTVTDRARVNYSFLAANRDLPEKAREFWRRKADAALEDQREAARIAAAILAGDGADA